MTRRGETLALASSKFLDRCGRLKATVTVGQPLFCLTPTLATPKPPQDLASMYVHVHAMCSLLGCWAVWEGLVGTRVKRGLSKERDREP